MLHVYNYYLGGYRSLTTQQAVAQIELAAPYRNQNCLQCHSGTLRSWVAVPEHRGLAEPLRAERVSCMGAGCHGRAHAFEEKEIAR